jgi:DNA modification methylase
VRWVDNLLYFYTHPLDVVVDPFAGGGSTIDICKKRLRRYWGQRAPSCKNLL